MSETFVFKSSISKLGSKKSLGIYIPKDVANKIEHLHGKKVFVIVYTIDE